MARAVGGNKISLPQPDELFVRSWSPGKFFRCMTFFGPAAIVASASVGAGETVLAVRTGAWSGYALLWLLLVAALTKNGFLQYALGRYTAITGEYVGDAWAKLPGPRGWFLWFITVIGLLMAPLFVSAISGACGGLLNTIVGSGDPKLWGTLFTVGAIGLGIGVSYGKLEVQQIFICIILVIGTLVGASFAAPSLAGILKGTFSFGHIPSYPDWLLADPNFVGRSKGLELATVFGYAGGVMCGYVVYAHWIALHGWGLNKSPQIEEIRETARGGGITYLPSGEEAVRSMRQLLTPLRYDVGLGAFVLFFVSAAFLIAGATILNPQHMMPGGYVLLSKQKAIWEQISPLMVPVYYVCILAALWGTLYALPEIYARVTHEFLGVLFKKVREIAYRRFFLYVGIYILVVSIFVLWTGLKPVTMMDIAAAISTNIGITLVAFGAIWLNFRLPRPYRLGRVMLVLLLITAVVLIFVSSVSVATLWAKYVG